MIALSRSRDAGKEGWGEARFMDNGFKDGQEGDGIVGGAGREKQLQCSPSLPSNCMDSISGEFALVINGHSLV